MPLALAPLYGACFYFIFIYIFYFFKGFLFVPLEQKCDGHAEHTVLALRTIHKIYCPLVIFGFRARKSRGRKIQIHRENRSRRDV